jgi:uncharacterized membrane protein YkvA (DUF1232 family)
MMGGGVVDYRKIFGNDVTADDIKRAKASFWKKMREVAGKVPFARQAAALYFLMIDPKTHLGVKATAVLALLYFISPVDFIPDFVPFSGFLDDAGVITAALGIIGPLMKPFLKQADNWVERGRPLEDAPEAVIDVEVIDVDAKSASTES